MYVRFDLSGGAWGALAAPMLLPYTRGNPKTMISRISISSGISELTFP
ncbi:unnamed protein product, partial [Callosobruchus maculatus]